jgi:hypothetical protein
MITTTMVEPAVNIWHEVRFHLSKGQHYKYWQVKTRIKGVKQYGVRYYNPADHDLILGDCELVNDPKTAQQVFETQTRDVCGWVRCREFSIAKAGEHDLDNLKMVVYDPKIRTYWHYKNEIDNIDGAKFEELFTVGKRVYCGRS